MAQAPKPLDPSLSAQHRFGAELRAFRIRKAMSQADLAKLIHVSPDLVAKVEKAVRGPTEALAISCDSVLDTGGVLAALWPRIANERSRSTRSGVQPSDGHLSTFEPLHQVANRLWRLGDRTAEAAMSVFDSAVADLVERYETEDPAALATEAVRLRRSLESMLHTGPSTGERQRLLGLAGRTSGLLAYMAVNLGRFAHADAYSIEAYALGSEAGDRGLMAWVRGTQSFASYYQHDYAKAVDYARHGLKIAGSSPQALRLKINCEARALAFLAGRRFEAEHAVTEAYRLADRLNVADGISPCISFGPYSRGRISANAITVFQTLGDGQRAVELVDQIKTTVHTSDSEWSRSLIHLDHAAILLHHHPAPDVEQAMHIASLAITASADRPITSIVQRGQALVRSTAQFDDLPSVREFHERMRMIVTTSHNRRRGLPHGRPLRSQT